MKTYIIEDLDIIKKVTGKDAYKKIILHIDNRRKDAKYESDYTLYDLTERVDYNRTKILVENI